MHEDVYVFTRGEENLFTIVCY